ncbi:MAG: tetratricopeptide repeat protein [Candidatus Methylomirabilales bacterium]
MRVTATFQYTGAIPDWAKESETETNRVRAYGELIVEDMAASGAFASVNAPGRQDHDLDIAIDLAQHVGTTFATQHTLKMVVKITDPATTTAIREYRRERVVGALFSYLEEFKATMPAWLSEIRGEMLAEFGGGALRNTLFAGRRAKAVGEDVRRARAAQARGDYPSAVTGLRRALAADPAGIAPIMAGVELLHVLCDPEGARRLGETSPKDQPSDVGFAAALAGTTVTPHPPACQAQQLNKDAVALARAGQRAEALAKLTEARRLAPGLVPKASYNAALLLEQSGKPQEAVAAYREAYQGFLLPADQQEALKRVVTCAQRHNVAPSDAADRRYRLGIVRAQQKRYPDAVAEFEAALAEAPWLVDAYYNLGLVYDFTDAPAPAAQALRTYLSLAPQSPHASAVKTKIVELEDKLGR